MGCEGCSAKQLGSANGSGPKSNIHGKLTTYDWLHDLPDTTDKSDIVEVRFKNTRKEYFRNVDKIPLTKGELIKVEAPSGYDVGEVSLRGVVAELQYKRKEKKSEPEKLKIIYKKASASDISIWQEAKSIEDPTMLKARAFAQKLNLEMKIGDVEIQADKTRATFYYIADGRIDFRELIKVFAQEFKVKIEMKQIGARQEAARIGGIGSCGRELCCSTWRTELPSVPKSAVDRQNLSSSADKFLGQCGKLKCCLMYELDTYIEANADFPKEVLELETKMGNIVPIKIDVLKKVVWYTDQSKRDNSSISVTLDRVKEIIMLNKKGVKVDNLN
jgi:cell fate regulator YaaT (PSP1 superfamily)